MGIINLISTDRTITTVLEAEHIKNLFVGLVLTFFVVELGRAIYNITFHPLAKFPGPFWAGVTPWWKTYEEVWKGHSLFHRLVDLHAEYGPIIRVSPDELSIGGPSSAYNEIYNARMDKDLTSYAAFGQQRATFGIPTVLHAKPRKDLLLPFFSKRSILSLENVIQEKTEDLIAALIKQHEAGVVTDLYLGYRCYSLDTITSFCFAQSAGSLQAPNFHAPMMEAMESAALSWNTMKHFATIRQISGSLPDWLTVIIAPAMEGVVKLQHMLTTQIKGLIEDPSKLQKTSHPVIYETLLAPDAHRGKPLAFDELYHESLSLIFGATDTTSTTLVTGTYHMLEHPEIAASLAKELKDAWPVLGEITGLGLEELEKLPFLTAVCKESLRMAPHITSGFVRVVPNGGKTIGGTFIPGGSKISMSVRFPHHDPTIFPDPHTFKPSRWLVSPKEVAELDRYLTPFSRGPRSCPAPNLAYAELYLAFGNVFRRLELELTETTPEQMAWKDCFVGHYPNGHLRVLARPVKD